ncbi:autotransporter domain-containing protein [Pseudomonas sp. QL9]|uniref:autotransporter outer membrane beta-barrel domain-containing protein n=1 Tax=Pseudomonas sp. QL9 TaxID=3242725 RepID=UPI00352B1368
MDMLALTKQGAATLALTGTNTYSGGTTISAGTLQLGNGGTSGSIQGDVTNNGTLAFNRSDAYTFAGAISGSGTLLQQGTGTTLLTGNSSTFSGTTNATLGTLLVNGTLGNAASTLNVASGATLGGSGSIGGSVVVSDGLVAPGNSSVGTLTIGGDFSLASASALNFEFGQAGVVGGPLNDWLTVGGNLTLDGTLNVMQSAGGNFAPGLYRVINYSGTLTDNGLLLGSQPAGSVNTIQTSIAGQVNLLNTAGLTMEFWDGGGSVLNNGVVDGGSGVWQASAGNENWTDTAGTLNTSYADGTFAIFAATPGTVTIDNSLGNVVSAGMQFAANGYVLGGQPLTLAAGSNVLRVGDGTTPGAGYVATIAADMIGAGGIDKTDLGTLVLAGNNTYSGGTTVSAGTLQLGNGGSSGSIQGNVTNNATLAFNRSDAYSFAGAISGTGALLQQGAGTTILTGTNTYSGGTTVSAGTLQLGNGGSSGSIQGNVTNNATLAFNRSDAYTFAGAISGSGTLLQQGTGTALLTGNSSTFSGTTNATLGTLLVNGTLGNAASTLNVASGATLGGSGSIGGSVVVSDGLVAPGNASVGTLTIGGDFSLASASALNFEFGQAGVVGGPLNDWLTVGGNLTLDGTLNVMQSAGGNFAPGLYRVINYSGTLTDNGLLLGSQPAGSVNTIQTSIAGQVNLLNTAGLTMEFWDGGGSVLNNGVVDGGSGVWQASAGNKNWTDTSGILNTSYADGTFAIFAATPGTVTIDNSLGNVVSAGMQFAANGYVLGGQPLTLAAGSNVLRVGDGTTPGAGYVATIAADMIGAGGIDKTDLGTLVLAGNNTYSGGTTVSAGTLQLGNGGSSGSIQGNVTNNATLAFNRSDAYSFAGAISGSGTLLQQGAGTTMLTGNSGTFSGTTNTTLGTLLVNGTLGNAASALNVLNGGTLGGNGVLGGRVNVQDGSIAPGGESVGNLTIGGDLLLSGSSQYSAEILPNGQADQLVVKGTTSLQGGSVKVSALPGDYSHLSSYTILSSDGGVNGQFGSLIADYAFIDLGLSYDPTHAYLTLARNTVSFGQFGLTDNQIASAGGAESLGQGNPLYDAIASLPNDPVRIRNALDQISGEMHASLKSAVIEDSHFARDAIGDRLLASSGNNSTVAANVISYKSAGVLQLDDPSTRDAVIWVKGFGAKGELDGTNNSARLKRNTSGVMLGGDAPVGDWRVGVMTGYSNSNLDLNQRDSDADIDSYYAGLYAGSHWDQLYLRSAAIYGHHKTNTTRNIVVSDLHSQLKSQYDSDSLQLFVESAYRWEQGSHELEPFANVANIWMRNDSFDEGDSPASIHSSAQDTQVTFSTIGMRESSSFKHNESTYKVRGMLGWRHAFGDIKPHSTHAFTGGDDFTVSGAPIAQNAALIELGLEMQPTSLMTLNISYQGQLSNSANEHGATVVLEKKF